MFACMPSSLVSWPLIRSDLSQSATFFEDNSSRMLPSLRQRSALITMLGSLRSRMVAIALAILVIRSEFES
jgi:hypothetical protein